MCTRMCVYMYVCMQKLYMYVHTYTLHIIKLYVHARRRIYIHMCDTDMYVRERCEVLRTRRHYTSHTSVHGMCVHWGVCGKVSVVWRHSVRLVLHGDRVS